MAEASLRAKIPKSLNSKIEVVSAGVNGFNGLAPTVEAELASRLKGYDLSRHRSRQATSVFLETCRLILCMEPYQTDKLRQRNPEFADRIFTLKGFKGGTEAEIPDPFQKDVFEYQRILEMIDVEIIRIKASIWKMVRTKLSDEKKFKGGSDE